MFQKAHFFLTAAIHTFLFFVFKSLTVALRIARGPQVPNHSKYTRSDLIYTIYIYVCTVRTANQCTDGGDVFFSFYATWLHDRVYISLFEKRCTFMSLKALTTIWVSRLMVTLCCWLFIKLYMHLDKLWLFKYLHLLSPVHSHRMCSLIIPSSDSKTRPFTSTTCPKDATLPNFEKNSPR